MFNTNCGFEIILIQASKIFLFVNLPSGINTSILVLGINVF